VAIECPICGFEGPAFEPGGPRMRAGAMCPRCGSLERQRLAWLFMTTETDLLSRTAAKRMLHVSPDPSLEQRIAQEPQIGQLTADLEPAHVMVAMDITNIQFPDGSFEIVYCSHVLEHVADDRRAISELHRVLAPGGWAIMQVPLWDGATDEDPTITGERERAARFGQRDHVRRYGQRDFPARLAAAGFAVTVDPFPRRIGKACVQRFGLTLQEDIHLARKPVDGLGAGVADPLTALLDRSDGPTGRVEQISGGGVVTGWAWDPGEPDKRLRIRALLDGRDVGGDVASRHRESLQAAGIGDGRYCFRIELPRPNPGARHYRLRVEAEGGNPLPPSTGFSSSLQSHDDPWYTIDVSAERR
jgi:hypothetical protein